MPTSTTQKWLLGCGIGCAGIIVLAIVMVTLAVTFVRGKFQPLQAASESLREVVAAHGAPDRYVPPADGAIPADRMEVFLSVRGALKTAQARLDAAMSGFDFERLNQQQPSFGEVMRLLNDLSKLIAPVGDYVSTRNHALLERRMGLGEYAYIYTIAFHSWLGHRPDEGPALLERARHGGRIRLADSDSGFDPESVRRQYRRVMLRLLENQLDAIGGAEQTKWRAVLRQEIERFDRESGRVAWQDGLPPAIEASLQPYRERLEAAYHPATNYFELLTLDELRQTYGAGPR